MRFLFTFLVVFCGANEHARSQEPTRYDWPLVRGDALGSGVVPGKLPTELKLAWKYSVPNGSFITTPVVAGGVAYLGDLDGTFYAIDLATGKLKWKHTAETSYSAAAAFRDGVVYVPDADGRLRAYEAGGKEKWHYQTESRAEINSSPRLSQGPRAIRIAGRDALLPRRRHRQGSLEAHD